MKQEKLVKIVEFIRIKSADQIFYKRKKLK